jgi:hypothetical protein
MAIKISLYDLSTFPPRKKAPKRISLFDLSTFPKTERRTK